MGRPSDYTDAMGDLICAKLAEGISLNAMCKADDMPDKATVYRWLRVHQAFSDNYARAREDQADTLADEINDIADDGTNDWMERRQQDGSTIEVVNSEHIQRSRLRVDARKWVASKLKPKKYGDKLTHEGGDPARPIRHEFSWMTPEK